MIPRAIPADIENNDFSLTADSLGLTSAAQLLAQAGVTEDQGAENDRFVPWAMKTRREERKMLGKPGDREDCFFCSYKGERDAVPAPRRDIEDMIDFLRDNFGRMKSSLLAKLLEEQYALIREDVNAKVRPPQLPLPKMSAATILDHMRKHTQDPVWKLVVMLEELQEAREELQGMLFDKSTVSKQKKANRVSFQCLQQVITMELALQTKDPSKMLFFSDGARIATDTMKQGPVSTKNKNLYSYLDKAGNKRK